jgi:ferredoxin-nitrite reductase
MRKELHAVSAIESSSLTEAIPRICPDIYHLAIARDGWLTRLRVPGGVLTAAQCETIADLLESIGLEYVQITNRANLQLRSLTQDLNRELLTKLTQCGLAASHTDVEGIRNVMLSPTAGIDAEELIDLRPVAQAWIEYLDRHVELGVLSNKFSVGFDGGGSVSISDRPNDITLLAVSDRELSLHLGIGERGEPPRPVSVTLNLAECLPMLAAIAQSYRQGLETLGEAAHRKPRLRDVIHYYGLDAFGKLVRREIAGYRHFIFENTALEQTAGGEPKHKHLGIHQQRQTGDYYLGVVLPLGRWTIAQVRGLGAISARYGSGQIRLTPWQNAIVPDVPEDDLVRVKGLINDLGLEQTVNHPSSLLRACAGATGCQFAATDTQRDAIALSAYLAANFTLDRPLNIHFSGCEKSCAQHDRADITLWGEAENPNLPGRYRIEIGGVRAVLEDGMSDLLAPEKVPIAIGKLIEAYQQNRFNSQESLSAFTNRQSPAQLQQLLHVV